MQKSQHSRKEMQREAYTAGLGKAHVFVLRHFNNIEHFAQI